MNSIWKILDSQIRNGDLVNNSPHNIWSDEMTNFEKYEFQVISAMSRCAVENEYWTSTIWVRCMLMKLWDTISIHHNLFHLLYECKQICRYYCVKHLCNDNTEIKVGTMRVSRAGPTSCDENQCLVWRRFYHRCWIVDVQEIMCEFSCKSTI